MLIVSPQPDRVPVLFAIYQRLPERGKQFPFIAVELNDSTILDMLDCDGLYKDGLALIARNGEEGLTFIHEFGHSVYERALARHERRSWGRYWRLHRNAMPATGGARNDAEEGFCECYAYYYRNAATRSKLNAALQNEIRKLFPERR